MVDTIAEKIIEKLRNIPFDIPADKDGGNESANFLRGEKKAIEVIFVNKLTNNGETVPEIPAASSQEENADPAKVLTTFTSNAPFVFSKHVVAKATMHGILLAPSTNG